MWKIVGGSIAGPHHKKKDEENQDFFLYKVAGNSAIIIATDGAGSQEHSRAGAELAAQVILEEIEKSLYSATFAEEQVLYSIDSARQAILAQENAKTMGCTVAVVVLGEFGWIAGLVGDAFVVLHHEKDDHELLAAIDESEYANVTTFLNSIKYEPLIYSGDEELLGASVSTDGLLYGSVERETPTVGFWRNIVEMASKDKLDVVELLDFMEINDKIVDDTTLVMAVREETID